MAERQETSVMASIQDILRDAQLREEQEKVAAQKRAQDEEQRRLDALRRQQEEEEARLRAEEEERQRRVFEEQRKAAELAAMQEATIQRAKMEAEAQARLAEMAARQEHERHLQALKSNKKHRTMTYLAIGLGVFFLAGAIGGGLAIKSALDKNAALSQQIKQIEDEKANAEKERSALRAKLENTKDPETIRQLQAQLDEKEAKIKTLASDLDNRKSGRPPAVGGGGGGPRPTTGGGGGGGKACSCPPGDPLCSCL